ncbi:MAG: hypothetical protein AAF437_04885 [Pseudomonadota bacterium]
MLARFLLVCVVFLSSSAVSQPSTAPEPVINFAECVGDAGLYLDQDFWTFDQNAEYGWRSISAKPDCDLAAADLISLYHRKLRTAGVPVIIDHPQGTVTLSDTGEIYLLYWHEGQIRASQDQTQHAVSLFHKSIKPEAQNYGAWNEYVLASIAFLENDLGELTRQRKLLAQKIGDNKANLRIVDGLIACFGKPYATAYGSDACDDRPVP